MYCTLSREARRRSHKDPHSDGGGRESIDTCCSNGRGEREWLQVKGHTGTNNGDLCSYFWYLALPLLAQGRRSTEVIPAIEGTNRRPAAQVAVQYQVAAQVGVSSSEALVQDLQSVAEHCIDLSTRGK